MLNSRGVNSCQTITHVAPPYLYILLGIVKKHHDLSEAAAHSIDLSIGKCRESDLTDLGKGLKDYGNFWQNTIDKEQQIRDLKTASVFCDSRAKKRGFKMKAKATMCQIQHENLDEKRGPVTCSLDLVLNKHRITLQPYHSGSFFENHYHRYLEPATYSDLTKEIIDKTRECTHDPFIIDTAHEIKLIFDQLNSKFSIVHKAVSHCKPVSKEDIPSIQTSIDDYMYYFRTQFPNKVIPKQHILKHHYCVPSIKHTLLGLGLLSKQGTEMCYQSVKQIEKRDKSITY